VVIAIISILAAILFPVFATAREKARQTQCASNMKQLAMAMVQYSQDYDETTVSTTYINHTGCWTSYSWRFALYPYVKSAGVYTCSSNTTGPNQIDYLSTGDCTNKMFGLTGLFVDYIANANLGRNGSKQYPGWCVGDCKNPGNGGIGRPLAATTYTNSYPYAADMNSSASAVSQIAAPAQCIAFLEQVPTITTSNNPIEEAVADYLDITNTASTNSFYAGHSGLTNYAFCDGHVKALKPLMTLSNADGGTAPSNYWERNGYSFSDQTSDTNYNSNDLPSALHIIQAAQKKFD